MRAPLSIPTALSVLRMALHSQSSTDAEKARTRAAIADLEMAQRCPEARAALHARPKTTAPRDGRPNPLTED